MGMLLALTRDRPSADLSRGRPFMPAESPA
jgi:hypothetical protein